MTDRLERHFSFVGEIAPNDMPDLYRRHDVFLLPSVWEEPFSIGLLEAMASGLTVIATATGGTPEVLDDGVNGFVFETEAIDELAAKVLRLGENEALRRHLSSAARATIERAFGIERMVDEVEALLKTALLTKTGASESGRYD